MTKTKVMVKVRVAYTGHFLQILYSQTPARQLRGELGAESYGLPDHPNVVLCLLDWQSVELAREFWFSREAEAQVAEWGAVGAPEILVLAEIAVRPAGDTPGLGQALFRIVAVVAIGASVVAGHAHDPHTHLAYSTDRVSQTSVTVSSSGSPTVTSTISLLGLPAGSTWQPPKG